ncbi:transglycosylase domain-containing protein [soil metagenome]
MNYRNKQLPKWPIILLSGAGILFAGFLLFLALIWFGFFGPVPSHEELSNIQQQEATRILSADGVQIGTYHLKNRTIVSIDEINPTMIDALLSIEDIRFHQHNGIDIKALGRVFVRTILLGQNAGGGSTITQQLAKNLYPRQFNGGLSMVADKFREMMIARKIESIYSKDEILELYLNTVSFGEDTFGIEMASYRFFSKSPGELTVSESATLAGILQATTFYNPHRNPERSVLRRNVVIRQMERYNFITSDIAENALNEDLEVSYNRADLSDGLAPYFREHLRSELRPVFDQPALDGKKYSLYTDGLTIHTTLNADVQRAAEQAVAARMQELQTIFDRELQNRPIFGEEDPDVLRAWRRSDRYNYLKNEGLTDEEIEEYLHTPANTLLFTWDGYMEKEITPYNELRYYLSFLNAGFIAMNPESGHVLAWVGGIDHRHFKFDQVTARRQPGSAFKPILYAAALENGRAPCDYQRNYLATYAQYNDWTPTNNQEEYGGRYSLQAALAQSINTVAVHLAVETGVPAIKKTASDMGIHSPIPEAPSIALGTANVSLLELTTAYTSFLNEGKPADPAFVTHITNASGEVIYDFSKAQVPSLISLMSPSHLSQMQVKNAGISSQSAAAMVHMLQKAVDEGTGNPLRSQFGIDYALGGKTGTTQNFTDGWFVGFTPDMVFGARVGGWNNRVRFSEYQAYGSQTALPIAGHFLQNLPADELAYSHHNPFNINPAELPYSLQCEDQRDDLLRDRLRDFFTGRSSDEARVVGNEDEEGGSIFRRIGRRIGISGN